jgi:DNA-binding GntR family transcriptional regulator
LADIDMNGIQSVGDQVYGLLLREISDGGLRPGAAMLEPELAARLGVSRTPVREAIGRLAGEGLVCLRRNRRAVVRTLSPDEIRHVYQVRGALESLAAREAAGRLTAEDLRTLRASAAEARRSRGTPGAVAAHHAFDRELHRVLAERSGNPVLAGEIRRYRGLVQLVRNQVGGAEGALDAAFREHRAILDAVAVGDGDRAAALMAGHIRAASEIAEAAARRLADAAPSARES